MVLCGRRYERNTGAQGLKYGAAVCCLPHHLPLDNARGEQALCGRPLPRIEDQEAVDDIDQSARCVTGRHRCVAALHDFHDQRALVVGLEGTLQCAAFVQDHTQSPHVTLSAVRFVLHQFWREVIRCPHDRCRKAIGRPQEFRHSKVAYLYRQAVCSCWWRRWRRLATLVRLGGVWGVHLHVATAAA